MKGQFRAVNRFITKISSVSSIDGVSNSGTFNVDDTTVGGFTLPQGAVTFYVTADFAQTGKEEIFRIVNVSGNTLTYDKRISVGGYTKPSHSAGASIRINDVADIINEMSDNIDNFGSVTQIAGTQTVGVWGGIFNNGGTVYNVANTTLAVTSGQLVDNTTNYIHFNLSTRLVSVEVSSTKAGAICFASVVVTGGIIGTITDLRPGLATTYGEISTKVDIAGGMRTTLLSGSTTNNGLLTANRTKVAVPNGDFATGSGSVSANGWIGSSANKWYAFITGTATASYDVGRMKATVGGTSGQAFISNSSASGNVVDADWIAVEPNTTYTVTCDYQYTYTSGSVDFGQYLGVVVSDGLGVVNNVNYKSSMSSLVFTTGIGTLTAIITTGPLMKWMRINMVLSNNMTSVQSAWFDNLNITANSIESVHEVTPVTSIADTDNVLLRNKNYDYNEISYSNLKTALLGSSSHIINSTVAESIPAPGYTSNNTKAFTTSGSNAGAYTVMGGRVQFPFRTKIISVKYPYNASNGSAAIVIYSNSNVLLGTYPVANGTKEATGINFVCEPGVIYQIGCNSTANFGNLHANQTLTAQNIADGFISGCYAFGNFDTTWRLQEVVIQTENPTLFAATSLGAVGYPISLTASASTAAKRGIRMQVPYSCKIGVVTTLKNSSSSSATIQIRDESDVLLKEVAVASGTNSANMDYLLTANTIYRLVLNDSGNFNSSNDYAAIATFQSFFPYAISGTTANVTDNTNGFAFSFITLDFEGKTVLARANRYIERQFAIVKGFITGPLNIGDAVALSGQNGTFYNSFTGLTADNNYYLSNGAGAISLTEGTVRSKVGVARSTTGLEIDKEYLVFDESTPYNPTSNSSVYTSVFTSTKDFVALLFSWGTDGNGTGGGGLQFDSNEVVSNTSARAKYFGRGGMAVRGRASNGNNGGASARVQVYYYD